MHTWRWEAEFLKKCLSLSDLFRFARDSFMASILCVLKGTYFRPKASTLLSILVRVLVDRFVMYLFLSMLLSALVLSDLIYLCLLFFL